MDPEIGTLSVAPTGKFPIARHTPTIGGSRGEDLDFRK